MGFDGPMHFAILQWGPYTSYSSNDLSFNGSWRFARLSCAYCHEQGIKYQVNEFRVSVLLKVDSVLQLVTPAPLAYMKISKNMDRGTVIYL